MENDKTELPKVALVPGAAKGLGLACAFDHCVGFYIPLRSGKILKYEYY